MTDTSTASPKGRFGPLAADDPNVGKPCALCMHPLQVGQVPSLVGDLPADAEEAAKAAAGLAYTAVADLVHETCAWPEHNGPTPIARGGFADLVATVRHMAQVVHQGHHTDQPGTWQQCPRAVCTEARHVLGIPDPDPT